MTDRWIAEATECDFKVALEVKRPKSWLKSVSAFANGVGGSLFFGIDNDGGVKRLDDVQQVCETMSSKIRDYADPIRDHLYESSDSPNVEDVLKSKLAERR